MKSSAGQLGAIALSEAALAVETAAANAAPVLPQLVAAVRECAKLTEPAFAERLRS